MHHLPAKTTRALKRVASAGAVAAVGLGFAAGATAQADTTSHGHFSKDGAVWLYKAGGGICKIYASQDLSPSRCLNASIVKVENHAKTAGVGGKYNARLYYNKSFQNGGRSAYACISPQDVWKKGAGPANVQFSHPSGGSSKGTGLHKAIWHDIARVQFSATGCGS